MSQSIIHKKTLTVMLGFLVIGGLAALLGIYRAAKDTDSPAYFV
jgi:hypothetical protein